MSKFEIRETRLLEMLSEMKRIDVKTVVDALKVSEATARRLFADLEKQGRLIRVHGGVQATIEGAPDYSFRLSNVHGVLEKTAIGEEAAKCVNTGDCIYLDSGTTILKMAKALATRLKLEEIRNVSILTNSLPCIESLGEITDVIFSGGIYRPSRRDFCGPLAEKNLTLYRFDKAFLGVDAISSAGDLLTTDDRTAVLNEMVIRNSVESFVLADSSKFNEKAFVAYARMGNMKTTLITDKNLKPGILKKIRGMKVKLIMTVDSFGGNHFAQTK